MREHITISVFQKRSWAIKNAINYKMEIVMIVDRYKIDKIHSKMKKTFGDITDKEEDYESLLFTMESNMIKVKRRNPQCTSRRVHEAINMALLTVDSYFESKVYEFGSYETEANRLLYDALLYSFDIFTNPEAKMLAESMYNLESKDGLIEYFTVPVRCLLRIQKSVKLWIREMGTDGYFEYIMDVFESQIDTSNTKLNFTVIKV